MPTSRFCWQAGWPEVGPCSAGSGLEVILRASHNPGLELGEPPGTWGCGVGVLASRRTGPDRQGRQRHALHKGKVRSLSH